MGTTAIAIPQTDVINTQALTIVEQAKSITVFNKATADKAAEVRKMGKQLIKQIDDTFDPAIDQAFKLHRSLIATKKSHTDPIEKGVVQHLNYQLTQYERVQEQKRMEEQRKAQEQARKDAEAQAEAEAALMASMGQHAAADKILEEHFEAPAPTVVIPKEKIEGVSFRSVWTWWITDITKIPIHLLTVTKNPSNGFDQEISTAAIGAMVRTLKDQAMKQIPGIEVQEKKTAY